jgi:hypothetical protein
MEAVRNTGEFAVYRPEWAASLRAFGHHYRVEVQRKHGSPIWLFKRGPAERDLDMLKARLHELQDATYKTLAARRLTSKGYRVVLDEPQQEARA